MSSSKTDPFGRDLPAAAATSSERRNDDEDRYHSRAGRTRSRSRDRARPTNRRDHLRGSRSRDRSLRGRESTREDRQRSESVERTRRRRSRSPAGSRSRRRVDSRDEEGLDAVRNATETKATDVKDMEDTRDKSPEKRTSDTDKHRKHRHSRRRHDSSNSSSEGDDYSVSSSSASSSSWTSSSSSSSSRSRRKHKHKHERRKKEKKHKKMSKKHRKEKKKSKIREEQQEDARDAITKVGAELSREPVHASTSNEISKPTPSPVAMPTSVPGTGTLSTNKTVVKGYATRFKSELQAKDGIIIRKGKADEEFRIVRFVLGDTSLSISKPFSTELATPTPFHIVPNPHRDSVGFRSALSTQSLPGTSASVVADAGPTISREELLDQRMKSKTDRMC